MRLTELNPRWTGTGAIITGLTFDCPHCRIQRLGIMFQNAIDLEGWLEKGCTRHHSDYEWDRTGETFDTMSLSPSIDTSQPPDIHRIDFEGHWHGFITNGEIT
jgi:hypothetical protein